MFEHYTEKARRVIFFGRYEASQFGSPYIETEHLLLGLLREDKRVAYRLLRSVGSADSIRSQIEERTTVREKVSTSVDLPLSNECKRILAYAAEEAERLSDKHIGTEHLLLGMLREEACFAAQLLQERGISLEGARKTIAGEPRHELGRVPKSQGIPAGYAAKKLVYNPASETLIVEMYGTGSHHLQTRLYMRRRDAEAYEKIGDPAKDVYYESPVTCDEHPIIVFNSSERTSRAGHTWTGVYSFNLSTKALTLRIPDGSLIVKEPHLRAWISKLVSLSNDAHVLYVHAAIEKELPNGVVVHYYLAAVDLLAKRLELLSPLKDIYF